MLSKTLLSILFVNFVSDSYGQKDKKFFRKDYTYIEEVQGFYKVYPIPNNWTDASEVCALEGATFWHPENDIEARAVISFWKSNKPNIKWLWSALTDVLVEGRFETLDGRPSTDVYNVWQMDKPDNKDGKEHCTHLDVLGELNDYLCDAKSHFICKKTLQSLEWNHRCDMPNLDYTFSNDTGKCYKLHTTPLKWAEANAICQLEQTSLALISNRLEADFLVRLTESTPITRVRGKYQRGIYHLGFHNRFNKGWRTVKGTPINADIGAWFNNYKPNEDDCGGVDDEECGSMFFNGRLINTDCNMKCFFICEHDVSNATAPVGVLSSDSQPFVGGGVD